jgi:adenine-specific DNA-methyltransferase
MVLKNNINGLGMALRNNEKAKPNTSLLETLKTALPEYFEKDIYDEEGNLTMEGGFKSDKFLAELKENNISEAHDGYKLGFVGKDYARLQVGRASETMIVPDCKHNNKEENAKSENIFITGDNLEALRHLVNAYERQIKLIYIDPPYNTGKEFTYSDSFEYNDEKLRNALGYSDEEISRLKSIQGKSSHSAWLTFMYPRLKLAQKLLKDDGVIFISIDDNELSNLKLLMDDVFGEGYFVGQLVVINNLKGRNDKKNIAMCHEYLLVYGKYLFEANGLPLTSEQKLNFDKIDKNGNNYQLRDLRKRGRPDRREDRPKMYFPVYYNEESKECSMEPHSGWIKILPLRGDDSDGRWRWGKERVEKNLSILEPKYSDISHRWGIGHRVYLNPALNPALTSEEEEEDDDDDERTSKTKSFWNGASISTDVARQQFYNIMNDNSFDYPKSVDLVKNILYLSTNTNSNDMVLDFFAGSATTAHAVMQLNAEDTGNRKFIMVQIDEATKEDSEARKAGYNTIDEIARKRIELVAKKIKKEAGLLAEELDLGFKHYRLITPDTKTLDKIAEFNPEDEKLFNDEMISPFACKKTGTSGLDVLLTTWLIDDGLPFNTKVEELEFADYKAHYVAETATLYLISPDWNTKSLKALLNAIGKNQLNVATIVIYPYSFAFEALRELRTNIHTNIENSIAILERY